MTENIHAIIDELAERYELETILNAPIDTTEPPFEDGWMEFHDDD